MKKIGIFGGSFDPPHSGHLATARSAKKALKLDSVLFVPSFAPVHAAPKQNTASALDRFAMCALALTKHPEFSLSPCEMERGKKTYTIELLASLQKQYPKTRLVFLMGADSLKDLPSWKNPKALLKKYDFAVFRRPGHALGIEELPVFIRSRIRSDISPSKNISSKVRGIYLLKNRRHSASSSELRRQLCAPRRREAALKSLPSGLARYIRSRKLYENAWE